MPLVSEFWYTNSGFSKKLAPLVRKIALLGILSVSISSGATLYDSGLVALSAADPVQAGRLGRNGALSDWSTPKDFPGVVNAATSYQYEAFALPSILYPYIQISVDDVSGTARTFVSAYLNSYSPNNTAPNYGLDVNYLGDEGDSGNLAGNPRAFQVALPVGSTLVLAVNDTSATGAGIGQPFRLIVDGFTDTNFSEAPEPASLGFVLVGLGVAAVLGWKKKARFSSR
jgi:hypothetical protein